MTKLQIWKVWFGQNNETETFAGTIQEVVTKAFVYIEKILEERGAWDRKQMERDLEITKIELVAEANED